MLTITPKISHSVPIEAECIRPDTLAGMALDAIQGLEVWYGKEKIGLGELFSLKGSAEDGLILLEGDFSRVKYAGAGMTAGILQVDGSLGMHAGSGMRGGLIRINGSADDWLGGEMTGGSIVVAGNAGNHVGAAYPGAQRGMKGGEIWITGNAGAELGSTLRRGLIVVGGDTGPFPGINLLAGTVVALGKPGLRPGAAMRRGSLIFPNHRPELLPTFGAGCPLDSVFPALYWNHLAKRIQEHGLEKHISLSPWPRLQRHPGDLVTLGKGEILCPA